jgi:thioredoxin-related protein
VKIIKIITIFLLFLNITFAAELKFENNFNLALKKANLEHKKLMMMYSATWCPECEYMKEVVFQDKEVANYIEKHFILLILDIQKDKLPKGFNHIGIPVFFIIDQNGKEKYKIIGGSKPKIFLKKLKELK